jgi:hypothetical protein
MTARKLVYWLLVFSPAILMLAVAIDARFSEDPFTLPEDPPSQNERIAAYAEAVRTTASLINMSPRALDTRQVEQVADFWVQRLRGGYLLPLYSSSRSETIDDGVKAQIFRAKSRVCSLLFSAAVKHLKATHFRAASADLLAAVELGEAVKYADFRALTASAAHQKKCLDLLLRLRPCLGAADGRVVGGHVRAFLKRQRSLAPLIAMSSKLIVSSTWTPLEVSPEDHEQLRKLTEAVRSNWSDAYIKAAASEGSQRCSSSGALLYFNDVRQAVQAQLELVSGLTETAEAFDVRDRGFLARL